MPNLARSFVLIVWIVLLTAALACSVSGQPTPTPPATPVPVATTPQAPSGSALALTLPNGQTLNLQARCAGVRPGEHLDVRAANTQDVKDPNRVEVQVGGSHPAAGKLDNMFVAVFVGAQDKWTFTGNTPKAQLTLEADGSGSFAHVPIVNVAVNSPTYTYGAEYKFSARWTCRP